VIIAEEAMLPFRFAIVSPIPLLPEVAKGTIVFPVNS
jgi:hypothetical protein